MVRRRIADFLALLVVVNTVSPPAAAGAPAPPSTPAAARTRVLLVATYHMGNPGADLNNVEAADVLAPARQEEIAAATTALARFDPNRVMVEWPAGIVDERYAQFLAGTLPVSRNEVVQLGFRLARERGLARVAGIDVDGDFPFDAVVAWAKAHGRGDVIDRLLAEGAAETARLSAFQDRTTVGGLLRAMNDPATIALNHSFYTTLLGMGSGDDQPGAALMSAWQARNTQICARLVEAASPGDRVVVFYGQGHIHLLRQCVSEQPGFEVADPLAYLPPAGR